MDTFAVGLVLFGGACLAMGAILGVWGALRYIGSLGWTSVGDADWEYRQDRVD